MSESIYIAELWGIIRRLERELRIVKRGRDDEIAFLQEQIRQLREKEIQTCASR